MIGTYAGVVFETSDQRVLTFMGLKKDVVGRYTQHDVIGRKPKTEFLGSDLSTLTFTIELHARMGVSPDAIIQKLERFVSRGRNDFFILGGKSLGRYNLVSMSTSYDTITERGRLLSAKVDLSLKEYGA